MDPWIYATVAAAFFQTLRFMLQKRLAQSSLNAMGATFARFIYALPFAGIGVAEFLWGQSQPMPVMTAQFWGFAALGGTAQILATLCVVHLFAMRSFAIGITLKKTETLQTAAVGMLLLGEGVAPLGWVAIAIGSCAVVSLGAPAGGAGWRAGLLSRTAGIGLLSGALFAISGVSYRGASLALPLDAPALRAAVTLTAVLILQAAVMGLWLLWRDPAQLQAVWRARRIAVWVGVTSLLGSLGWFTAFTLQNAALVNALGQIELLFSMFVTWFVFHERLSARELFGMMLLLSSVFLIIFAI